MFVEQRVGPAIGRANASTNLITWQDIATVTTGSPQRILRRCSPQGRFENSPPFQFSSSPSGRRQAHEWFRNLQPAAPTPVPLHVRLPAGRRFAASALVRPSKSSPSSSPLPIHRPVYPDSVCPASTDLECLPLGSRKLRL